MRCEAGFYTVPDGPGLGAEPSESLWPPPPPPARGGRGGGGAGAAGRGGGGADSFVFDQTPGAAHRDTITDYNVAADTILLDNADFRGLAAGKLNAGAFVRNASGNAADVDDRIIYETDTGKLFFDRDGSGSAAKVHFATLDANLGLTNADFLVF